MLRMKVGGFEDRDDISCWTESMNFIQRQHEAGIERLVNGVFLAFV